MKNWICNIKSLYTDVYNRIIDKNKSFKFALFT